MRNKINLQERVKREYQAHTGNDVLAESYRLKDRFSHIWCYPSRNILFSQINNIVSEMDNKTVLDYGCGRGESSLRYLTHGAIVQGIDISPTYISEASRKAEEGGFSPKRFHFHVMDAHQLDFDNETFDLVIGEGILHHLDAEVALREIRRVLKPGGRVLMLEPLADNPLLKLFRLITPRARTDDEAPFTGKDIASMTRSDWWQSETKYCGLIEAPLAMVTSVLIPNRPDNALLRIADGLERWMHSQSLLLSWNQYCLLNLIKL